MTTAYDFSATAIDGAERDLSEYRGKVLLIVNTATQCGFTPQLQGLEDVYREYAARGLVVLGFPCNQFGAQNPGSDDETATFCERNYGVSFPMFAEVDVNGEEAHPLYRWLRTEKSGLAGSRIKWNFTKFLVGKDGQVIDRYAPTTKPEKLGDDIEKALG